MADILKKHCVLPSGPRTIETMGPNKLEFPQNLMLGEEKSLEPGPARGKKFRKEIHICRTAFHSGRGEEEQW